MKLRSQEKQMGKEAKDRWKFPKKKIINLGD